MIKTTEQVEYIITVLEGNGFEAYAVGGCVRDSILGIEPKDWDICTSAFPNETINCFEGHTIIKTGIDHGTVTLILDGIPFEITTFRIDGSYSDNRHPDSVAFVRNIQKDLQRRDFTINAMAYSKRTGIIDYFGGREDIYKRLIRCVGNPGKRFNEDGLRILRGLRFASRFGFSIEDKTAHAIIKNAKLLNNIAAERIFSELKQFLTGRHVYNLLTDFAEVFAEILPEIKPMFGFDQRNPYHCYDVWIHTVKAVESAPPDATIRLALLLHDIGKPSSFTVDENGTGHFYGHPNVSEKIASVILKRLKADKKTTDDVLLLVKKHDVIIEENKKSVRRSIVKMGTKNFEKLLIVKRCDAMGQAEEVRKPKLLYLERIKAIYNELLREEQCFKLADLKVNGNDIISQGIPRGKRVGEILELLFNMVVNEEIENNREILLKKVNEIKK